jgi:hypothetical protein
MLWGAGLYGFPLQSSDRTRPTLTCAPQGPHFEDTLPLVANGRCRWRRCPAALIEEVFAGAMDALQDPNLELNGNDWLLYGHCTQVNVVPSS